MVTTVEAIYDGNVLRPKDPLALAPNTQVRITIETVEPDAGRTASFLRTASSLQLDGPRDWASNLDAYLYGAEGDTDAR